MALKQEEIKILKNQIQMINKKIGTIEERVVKIDKEKEFDYQKVLSTLDYFYKYYDDMSKDKIVEITS